MKNCLTVHNQLDDKPVGGGEISSVGGSVLCMMWTAKILVKWRHDHRSFPRHIRVSFSLRQNESPRETVHCVHCVPTTGSFERCGRKTGFETEEQLTSEMAFLLTPGYPALSGRIFISLVLSHMISACSLCKGLQSLVGSTAALM